MSDDTTPDIIESVENQKKPRRRDTLPSQKSISADSGKNQNISDKPLRVLHLVVQLNRYAMKYVDLKGAIAHKYFSPDTKVTWSVEPGLAQIPSVA